MSFANQSNRNSTIDAMRGCAIFLIVWSHLELGWILNEVANPIILGLFFMISGYFYKFNDIPKIIKKKSKSLLLPWIIFVLIGYCYHLFFALCVDHTPFRWGMLVNDLIWGVDYEANIPCWFFIALFEVIILYTVLYPIRSILKTIIIIGLSISGNLLLSDGHNYFYISKSLFYLLFFHIGYKISVNGHYGDNKRSSILYVFALIICIVLLAVKSFFVESQFWDYTLGTVICCILFDRIIAFHFDVEQREGNSAGISKIIQAFCWLGRNSMVILAIHILVIDFVWRLLWPYFGNPNMLQTLLYAIISTILCLPVIKLYGLIFNAKQ